MDRLWDGAELGITPQLQRKLNRQKFDAAMGWRGTEKAEKSGEWLETWLRGYAEFVKAQDHLPIMIMWKA